MPLTTRAKVAIGLTVVGVLAAVTTVAVASSSSPKSAPPLPPGAENKHPPPPPPPQKGKPPPPKIHLPPQKQPAPPPPSNLPQTIHAVAGGTYHTKPAPNGTVLTVDAPAGSSKMTATQTATGLRSGIVQGRFYYAVLDGGAGKIVLQWVDANDNAQTATVLVVGA